MALRIGLFLLINFGALAIGGLFTGKGVPSEWYQQLNKAPWTPPGWVFGAAWSTIMICYALFMAQAWKTTENQRMLLFLFAFQWVLNVAWNPLFFYFHFVGFGLIVISLLTLLMVYFLFHYFSELKLWSLLLLPYVMWLLIATSLNGYILVKN